MHGSNPRVASCCSFASTSLDRLASSPSLCLSSSPHLVHYCVLRHRSASYNFCFGGSFFPLFSFLLYHWFWYGYPGVKGSVTLVVLAMTNSPISDSFLAPPGPGYAAEDGCCPLKYWSSALAQSLFIPKSAAIPTFKVWEQETRAGASARSDSTL
jgi:hypothetical protein